MPVQQLLAAASAAARRPHRPKARVVSPKNIQPIANASAGKKVATENTPSRDSHEVRHCEKARHARSGRPRWNTEELSPPTARTKAAPRMAAAKPGSSGNAPSGAAMPTSSSSANPAPDAVVKKMIESVGYM